MRRKSCHFTQNPTTLPFLPSVKAGSFQGLRALPHLALILWPAAFDSPLVTGAILPSLRHVGRIPALVSLHLVWFTLPETLFWILREWTPHSFRPLMKCYATVWGIPWPPRVPQPSPWPVFPSSTTHALIFLQSTHLLQQATFPGLCFSVPPHQATGSTG